MRLWSVLGVLCLSALFVLLAGCSGGSDISTPVGPTQPGGSMRLSYTWSTGLTRARAGMVLPGSLVLEVGGRQGVLAPGQSSLLVDSIPVGDQRFTVRACAGADGSGDTLAMAEGVVSIRQGVTVEKTVSGNSDAVAQMHIGHVATQHALVVEVGSALQIIATAVNAQGEIVLVSPGAVIWQSLQPGVAAVSGTGLVTGVSEGKATIRASRGMMSVEVPVRVVPSYASLDSGFDGVWTTEGYTLVIDDTSMLAFSEGTDTRIDGTRERSVGIYSGTVTAGGSFQARGTEATLVTSLPATPSTMMRKAAINSQGAMYRAGSELVLDLTATIVSSGETLQSTLRLTRISSCYASCLTGAWQIPDTDYRFVIAGTTMLCYCYGDVTDGGVTEYFVGKHAGTIDADGAFQTTGTESTVIISPPTVRLNAYSSAGNAYLDGANLMMNATVRNTTTGATEILSMPLNRL